MGRENCHFTSENKIVDLKEFWWNTEKDMKSSFLGRKKKMYRQDCGDQTLVLVGCTVVMLRPLQSDAKPAACRCTSAAQSEAPGGSYSVTAAGSSLSAPDEVKNNKNGQRNQITTKRDASKRIHDERNVVKAHRGQGQVC